MTVTADKPHLSREHMLDLLKQMIRIRRFEDKCYELYTQEKIRGFMHLYDGEEAVAVGVMPVLEKRDRIVATYREHGHALVRGVSMTACAWPRCTASRKAAAAAAAVPCICSTAATNFHGGNAIVGGGLPLAIGLALADTHAAQRRRHGLLLRRRRGGRGRIPRKHESGGAVGLARTVRVRKQSLRHGNRVGYFRIGNRHSEKGGVLSDGFRGGRRHGCDCRRGGRSSGDSRGEGKPQAVFSGMPDLSVSRAFDVRRATLPRQG